MGERDRIEGFREAARRCLQARDGKDLRTQAVLTRAARRYEEAGAALESKAAPALTSGRRRTGS